MKKKYKMAKKEIATYRAIKQQNGAVKVFIVNNPGVRGLQGLIQNIVIKDETLGKQETYDIQGTVNIEYDLHTRQYGSLE